MTRRGTGRLPPYIQKRRRLFYATLEIPKDLRRHYPGKAPGKRLARLVRSLETDSLSQAERRVAPIVAAWRAEFARLRGEPQDDAAFFRRSMAKATTTEERERIVEAIADEAWDIGAIDVEQVGMPPMSSPKALDFYVRATGQLTPLKDHVDEWLATLNVTPKTKAMQASDARRFADAFTYVQDVTHAEVQSWTGRLLVTPKTKRRVLSALRGFWKYLQRSDVNVAPRDQFPFDHIDLPRKAKKDMGRKRQPFTPADVVKLLRAAADDRQLADLIRLAMYTGCRIEELCSLKIADVAKTHFKVTDAKTVAGVREVPIHKELSRTIARLVKESDDGYLLSGLTENKYGDRSNAIGKRFGRLKKAKGYGEEFVFHSIRRTVATLLENADVSENIAADIIGHEKPRLTYGLYSGGSNLAVKAKALAKLKYPAS